MRRMMLGCLSSKRLLAFDSFSRANGALGTAEFGGTWIDTNATVAIVSQNAKGTEGTYTNVNHLVMPQLDYDVSADVTWYTGEVVSLCARLNAISNYMRVRYDGTNVIIQKVISGSSTNLGSAAFAWTSGATMRFGFSVSANTFTASIDGVKILSVSDDNITKTYYGVGFGSSKSGAVPASTFDNFMVLG